MKRLRFFLRIGVQLLLTLFLLVCMLEWAYRGQWIDFYANEFQYLNAVESKENRSDRPILMVFGDSFTASPHSYVHTIDAALPNWRVVNHAVPGIGARQIKRIANARMQAEVPDAVMVQLYVGNDLLDQCPQVDWRHQGLLRNTYHFGSQYLEVLPFLNYRMGQWKNALGPDTLIQNFFKVDDTFEAKRYNQRVKRLLHVNPEYISESALLNEDMKAVHLDMLADLDSWLAELPDSVPVLVVCIPHAVQVNKRYLDDYLQLGARFSDLEALTAPEYPFIKELSTYFSDRPQITVVNPVIQFQQNDNFDAPLYLANDPHLTQHGQRVLAQVLLKAWQKSKKIKSYEGS